MSVQREVEKMHPKKFEYVLAKDPGVTGNLEINFSKRGGVDSSSSELIHSKRKGQGYPHADWEAFHGRLDKALQTAPQ